MKPLNGRPPYRPDVDAMRARLSDLGECLAAAAVDLQCDPTPERCDQFASRLQSALHFTAHIRRGLVQRETKTAQ